MSCAFGPAVVAAFVFATGNGNKDNVIFDNARYSLYRGSTSEYLLLVVVLAARSLLSTAIVADSDIFTESCPAS